MERPYFPMFVDLTGKKVLMAGGGKIALRRVQTLRQFGAVIHVTAPELCGELLELERQGKITAERREYKPGDTSGYDMVLAATDSRETNRMIWEECRKSGVTVNVADDKSLCDFYFPSVVMTENAVVGISSGGEDPSRVKELRKKIEKIEGNLHKYK